MSLSIVFWIAFFHILFILYFNLFNVMALFIQFNYTIVKLFLLKHIANYALELGLIICISAPTGKLASKYAMEHPMCRCNTVHTNYFNPVGNSKQRYAINWGLSDVHVLLVDEVIKFSHVIVHTRHKYQY